MKRPPIPPAAALREAAGAFSPLSPDPIIAGSARVPGRFGRAIESGHGALNWFWYFRSRFSEGRRWGEAAIRRGMPMAMMEEILVPAYMYHAFQLEATASTLGGMHYIYALRGDGRDPAPPVPAAEQRAALSAVLATLKPAELALPEDVIRKLPPRPSGYPRSRELFPRYTGLMFDKVSPAASVASMAVGSLLAPDRAARLAPTEALVS